MQRSVRVLAAFLVFVALVSGSPAAAQGELLTVTPSTGLVQGETVEIRGTGSTSPISGIGVCSADAVLTSIEAATDSCQLLTFQFDGAAELGVDWGAQPIVTTNAGRPIDCRAVGCQVVYAGGASLSATPDFVRTHVIEFADAAFVTVTPATSLVDQQMVEVNVALVPPDATVEILGCVGSVATPAVGSVDECVDLAPGDDEGTWRVERWIPDADGVVRDCATTRCAVGARLTDGSGVSYVLRNVSFSGAIRVEVTVDGPIDDGEVFTVDAVNADRLARNRTVSLCVIDLFSVIDVADCAATDALVDDSESSTYSSNVTGARYVDIGGTTYDCAKPIGTGRACIYLFTGRNGPSSASPFLFAELLFTASITRVPDIEIAPADDFDPVQLIDVLIDEASTDPAVIGVCPRAANISSVAAARVNCDLTDLGPHPARFESELTVRQSFSTEAGQVVCATIWTCELVYLAANDEVVDAPRVHRLALRFARRTSIFPLDAALDGQEVYFELVGYATGDDIVAVPLQCGFGATISFDDYACRAGTSVSGTDGVYNLSMVARRFIERPGAPPIDCAQSPTRCLVGVLVWTNDGTILETPAAPLQVRPFPVG